MPEAKRLLPGLCGVLLSLLALEARAEDGLVDEVVVVATREPVATFRLPASVHVVDRRQIAEGQYRSLPQALRGVPGAMVQETAFGQGSPYLRGFTGFRNLFLVDGVRLNNSVFRDGPNQYWATVDVHGLERLEVLQGPASSLYGSDAVGGTVNASTGDPFLARSRALVRAASAESSLTSRLELALPGERWAARLGATGKTFGDLEGGPGVGEQPGVGYDEHALDLKVARHLAGDWRLDTLVQHARQNNVPRTHRTVESVPWHGTSAGSDLKRELDQERQLGYLRLGNTDLDGPVDATSFTLAYSRTEEVRDRVRGSGARDLQGFTVNTLGLLAQARSATSFGVTTYGIDVYRDHVDSFSTGNPVQGPVADDARYRTADVYLQHRVTLAERAQLVLGARHTRAEAEADGVLDPATGQPMGIDDDWSATVANLGLAWEVVPGRLVTFGSVAQGFRAPNLSDLTRFDSARSNELEVPTPGLEEERFVSAEMGVKLRGQRVDLRLAVFRTWVDDLIQRVPTGRNVDDEHEITKANLGDGRVDGVEASWRAAVTDQVRMFGTLSWLDGEVETFPTSEPVLVREPLDRLMPLTASLGVRWTPGNRGYWIEGMVLAAEGQDRLSTRDASDTSRIPPGGTPGYVVVHLRAGGRIGRRLEATVGVDNLNDEDYRIHGSGTNMPGRNLVLTLQSRL